jgi:hypothetical protein
LLTDFIEQWSRNRSDDSGEPIARTEQSFNWQYESAAAKFSHKVVLTTAGVQQDIRLALLRTVGHFILSRMPEEGLTETLESLAETYTYWLNRKYNTLEPARPASTFYNATAGPSYDRPKFHVSED